MALLNCIKDVGMNLTIRVTEYSNDRGCGTSAPQAIIITATATATASAVDAGLLCRIFRIFRIFRVLSGYSYSHSHSQKHNRSTGVFGRRIRRLPVLRIPTPYRY